MKGIIFNALEEFVNENFGEGTFDFLVEKSLPDKEDTYVGPGTYSDEELFKIVETAVEVKNLDLEETLKGFGVFLFTILAGKYPQFLEPFDNAKDFIKTVHDIIHVEVRKLFPEAETPSFSFFNESKNTISLRYESKRKLFTLAEGLIEGAGNYYNQKITINRSDTNTDQGYCVFNLSFS